MKYVLSVVMALFISLYTYQIAAEMIGEYSLYSDVLEYDLHNLDFIAIMLGSTDLATYPYLNLETYKVLLPAFSFYMIGMLIAMWRFIGVDHSYHPFLLSRLPKQSKFFRYLQKGMYMKIIVYSLSYSAFCYVFVLVLAPYPKDTITLMNLGVTILFTVSRILILAALSQLTMLVYLKMNAIIAQFFALFMIVLFLMIGMKLTIINLLFFNAQYYFVPAIMFAIIVMGSSFIIKKKMIYQMLGE